MKKRLTAVMLALFTVLTLVAISTVAATYAAGSGADITGSGTADDPYLIYTAEGLKEFRDIVNGENGKIRKPGAHAKLMNDIVLNDGTFDADGNYTPGESGKAAEEWTPIGMENSKEYSGTFDGDGHTIKGLYVKDRQYAGLFGRVWSYDWKSEFDIKDLTVTGYIGINSNSVTGAHAGGIVGDATIRVSGRDTRGTISNCVSHVVINVRNTNTSSAGTSSAGGIVGCVNIMNSKNHTGNMEITNCANHAAITAYSENGNAYAGGIVGRVNESDDPVQKINSCFNAGKICASSDGRLACAAYAGGIVGSAWGSQTDSSIANCLNVGEVTGVTVTGSTYTGGIAGIDRGVPISNCCNAGKVGENGCGIAEHVDDDDVSNCYYLEGTADMAYNGREDGLRSKAAFADGTVLELLQNGDENSPWERCDYLKVVGMMLPLLKGQADDTFRIYTAQDLKTFRTKVNAGETPLCAKLMNDIDLGEEEWLPIGSESHPYAGSFDGQGYTVNALKIMMADCAGLFGYTNGATIKNVTVIGKIEVGVSAYKADEEYVVYAGGVVGRAANTRIENCTNKVRLYASFSNDYFNINKDYTAYAGGIAGYTSGSTVIAGCTNSGKTLSGSWMASAYAGGMTGYAQNGVTIENCLNNAEVSATTTRNKTLPDGSECDAIMAYARAGGMVGVAADGVSVTGCYNIGEVSTLANGDASGQSAVGGIIGVAFAQLGDITVANCGNAAKLFAWGKSGAVRAGGIVCEASAVNGCVLTISDCYSTGSISIPDDRDPAFAYAGGAAGLAMAMSGNLTISNCYWLTDTCDKAVGNIQGSPTITRVAAHSKNDFATGFVQSKFDAASAWTNRGYLNAAGLTLPLLSWQTADAHIHSEKTGICLNGIYCECGCLMHMATSGHDWSEWRHLTTSHNRNCKNPGCGVTQSGNCSGGTATCTEPAECSTCGGEYGNIDPNNHTGAESWTTTATHHEKKWSCCNAVSVASESHEWAGGSCSECGYACTHTGGTATCTEKATCAICGEKYGDIKSHNYSADWSQDVSKHWHKCKNCDARAGEAAHNDADRDHKCDICATVTGSCADNNRDHKCDICGKVLSTHTGGKVTCTEKATCAICGEKYGEITSHSYSEKWVSDDTEHWHECTVCGGNTAGEAHTDADKNHKCDICGKVLSTHTGGTATCTEKATCELCGEKYGDIKSHDYSADWSQDAAKHWHKCKNCEARAGEAAHDDADKNHKCDICDKVLSECADNDRDHKCDICGKALSTHTGGKATCKEKATCELCGEKYGENDANNHAELEHIEAKSATKTSEGNTEYWYCSDCGRYYGDAAAEKEIAKADTVTAKLPDDSEPPQEEKNTNTVLLIALSLVGVAIAAAVIVIIVKKKHIKK